MVDDSNKRPEKTLFLNMYEPDDSKHSKQMYHSIEAVENLLKSNWVKCFNTIRDVADFINNA